MTDQADLFGHKPAQGSLFGEDDDRMQAPRQKTTPDPDVLRARLNMLVEKVRKADRMPWPEREARMWQTVFPNMTKWLPEEEAAQLRFAFTRELERLKAA